MNLDKLFKHLADEHGLLLLESEKREIADCLPPCTCQPSFLGAVIGRASHKLKYNGRYSRTIN
jgi:hypothetical protein